MSRYKKLTKQQRETYRALRELGGVMTVTPDTARQLRALQARGLVRYAHEYGARVAVLKRTRFISRTARKLRATDTAYTALTAGAFPFIPTIEGKL